GRVWIISQHLDTCSNAKEFRYRHASISNEQSKHSNSSPADTKLLTNEISETFPCDNAHASAHFLYKGQAEASNGECPEKIISITGACLREGGNATGIIACIGGNQARSQNGKKFEQG